MSVVVISTVTFVLGTMPELTDNLDIMLFDNETETADSPNFVETTPLPNTVQPVERWEEVSNNITITLLNSIVSLLWMQWMYLYGK